MGSQLELRIECPNHCPEVICCFTHRTIGQTDRLWTWSPTSFVCQFVNRHQFVDFRPLPQLVLVQILDAAPTSLPKVLGVKIVRRQAGDRPCPESWGSRHFQLVHKKMVGWSFKLEGNVATGQATDWISPFGHWQAEETSNVGAVWSYWYPHSPWYGPYDRFSVSI